MNGYIPSDLALGFLVVIAMCAWLVYFVLPRRGPLSIRERIALVALRAVAAGRPPLYNQTALGIRLCGLFPDEDLVFVRGQIEILVQSGKLCRSEPMGLHLSITDSGKVLMERLAKRQAAHPPPATNAPEVS